MLKYKSPKEIEAIVSDYYNNQFICMAFGIDYFERDETDKEHIRNYVKRIYVADILKKSKHHELNSKRRL